VALSTADAEKWRSLSNRDTWSTAAVSPDRNEPSTRKAAAPQRQVRLNAEQTRELVSRYVGGATVYELAREFGCNRKTAAEHVKRAGVPMRIGRGRGPATTGS